MKIVFFILLAAMVAFTTAAPVKLTMAVSDSNGGSFAANIVFDGDKALEFGPELSASPAAIFYLASLEWTESESGRRVTLAQAREWADSMKAKALVSMERIQDADQRAFLQELLSPSFAVGEGEGQVNLKSQFFSYTASEPLAVTDDLKKQIFAFDELNALRKAMVLRQSPPFTQLEITRILREKGIFPSLLIAEITTPNGSVRVTIRYKLVELTPEERAIIAR